MVQRTAARWTCRRWHNTSHVGEMLDDLEWSTLEKRRINTSLTFFYKIHNRLVDIDRDHYLLSNKTSRYSGRLSHSQQYDRQTTSSDLLKFSFFPRVIPLWNALPESTVAMTTVDSFKAHLNQLHHQFVFNVEVRCYFIILFYSLQTLTERQNVANLALHHI